MLTKHHLESSTLFSVGVTRGFIYDRLILIVRIGSRSWTFARKPKV